MGLLLLSTHHSSKNENFWVKECGHCKAFVARLPSREVAAYLYTYLEHMHFQILLIAGFNHCFNFLPESNSVGFEKFMLNVKHQNYTFIITVFPSTWFILAWFFYYVIGLSLFTLSLGYLSLSPLLKLVYSLLFLTCYLWQVFAIFIKTSGKPIFSGYFLMLKNSLNVKRFVIFFTSLSEFAIPLK